MQAEIPRDDLHEQLAKLSLNPHLPLLISDADEVLLRFVQALEKFLIDNGYKLTLTSFALTGNIRQINNQALASPEKVKILIRQFFHQQVDQIEAVTGAAEALRDLSQIAQIVILSNVPADLVTRRAAHLQRLGMPYPVITNRGEKGTAAARLARMIAAPIFFIDDIPGNIAAVARKAPHITRIHCIADSRLAKLSGPAADCHVRLDQWPDIAGYIKTQLER